MARSQKSTYRKFRSRRILTARGKLMVFAMQPAHFTRIYFLVVDHATMDGILPEGTVLIPRWHEWDLPKSVALRHDIYPDIFSAMRGTLHAILGYDPEVGAPKQGEVERLIETHASAAETLAFMRSIRKLKPDGIKELQSAFGGMIEVLEHSRDEKKVRALEQFLACYRIRDSLGRLNLGVLRARTVSGKENLIKRLENIRSIGPRLALQLMVLEQELTLMFRRLESAENKLHMLLKDHRGKFEKLTRANVRYLSLQIGVVQRSTKVFKAVPFVEARALVNGLLLEAKNELEAGQGMKAFERLETVRQEVVCPLMARTELAAIHRDTSLLEAGRLSGDMVSVTRDRFASFTREQLPWLVALPGIPIDEVREHAKWALGGFRDGDLAQAKESIAQIAVYLDDRDSIAA